MQKLINLKNMKEYSFPISYLANFKNYLKEFNTFSIIYGVGKNDIFQLGVNKKYPIRIEKLSSLKIVKLATGGFHTLALSRNNLLNNIRKWKSLFFW